MATVRFVEPVVRFCAVITRYPTLCQQQIENMAQLWGAPVAQTSPIEFHAGGFYTDSMGTGLTKTIVAFDGFADPAQLADWKQQTNRWEAAIAHQGDYPESRPINLDPGYATQAKFVLATTKDRDHRIYLRDGMFAEVTLNYVGRRWQHHRWTYPSYRTEEVAQFANQCRQRLRAYLRANQAFRQV